MMRNNTFFLISLLAILLVELDALATEMPSFSKLAGTKESEIVVNSVAGLVTAIDQANSGGDKTIIIEDGVYTLDDMLPILADGITVKSASENRDTVTIQGRGMEGSVTHIFNVAGSFFTVRDVTLRAVSQHAIQLQIDVDDVLMHNLHILDTGEQMVKVAYEQGNPNSSDDGVLEHCLLEYSAGVGPQYYIGGIDAHFTRNWLVRDNIFINIRSPSGQLAEHAIHFWSDSEDTLVERNLIINCDRGIGFGLGDRGHIRGIIRNNMIYHNETDGFADVGIGLERTGNAQVYNNSIFFANTYPNAIEYRYPETTGVYIANNLTNKGITARDGASATLSNNITTSESSWFVQPESGDLHLSSALETVVDQGVEIPALTDDFDGDPRPVGSGTDIGADEYYVPPTPELSLLGIIFLLIIFSLGTLKIKRM
ncbi:right-handed parallel beta-helix repeat-containing protein [candidate division CSSED10-310 bacterium]|uniref:Right-handed parallel beta-helix repeat-containing protein n=1 Tax=candidate division CSSED10-310 bacterium TaxID=2855610 RepID=A0ABV6YXB3_UNCC1